jgi:RsiW-degrading membrane proteinase PrsW (M82 family)
MSDPKTVVGHMPRWVFPSSIGYLIVLLGGTVLYFVLQPIRDVIPSQLGPIPVAVPWWGATGAVTASLYGVFFHNNNWDQSYNHWHISRPLLGAVLGMVAYLIFVVVIDATGVQAKTSGNLVYYVVAFLVGYREETFHGLIQRATDVLFTSATKHLKPGEGRPNGPS